MNSVLATTYSAVYLAMRHIFPDTPLNAGAFEPLMDQAAGAARFLDAQLSAARLGLRGARCRSASPRRCFWRWCRRIPDKVTAAPAGRRGNFALGGFDPAKGAGYVMYQISGGGYGGNAAHDGLEQRLLDHRHLQEPAGGGAGAILIPMPIPPLCAARGLGRRRQAPRRLRRAL